MSKFDHEAYWPKFKELAQSGRFDEIKTEIQKIPDPYEQIALYRFAVRSLMFREWSAKTLAPLIKLGDLGIEKALEVGETDEANMICYNMSANLADCWNDGFSRTAENFKKGLAYADRALDFRRELKKGPIPFSIAHWAKGMHLYSVQDYDGAEENFKLSLNYAIESAKSEGKTIAITANTSFFLLLSYGYLALAQLKLGKPAAEENFNEVIKSFEGMKDISTEAKEDAELGIQQLQFVRSKP